MFHRLINRPTRNVLAVGVVIIVAGMLVIPTNAIAKALKFTGIEGTSTNKADVTSAGQLLSTEASPSTFEEFHTSAFSEGGGTVCDTIGTVPSGQGFVLRQVQLTTTTTSVESVYIGSGCPSSGEVASGEVSSVATTFSFTPGLAVASGGQVSVAIPGGDNVTAFALGYSVPSADVPATTS